ncbi:hypothetical protein GCK72_002995 [Caenorhabditis remanei]|uniref:Uncharacterized protein n=2 Tax=Caenorhabditis remanei TaxID=31234 RepID=A0A6A5HTV6_CAERE|nr:hypothetical protein GCK72_002995 [Caenorhabditis remanei]KAF1771169.1 hypothetical protein GCK72_002995 [Caenorhabditis remanei]
MTSSRMYVIPTNEEDQTMIESHELLSMACAKYREEKNARDKEPRLRYTTMQMSLIGHLCDVVRKELDELKRAEEQKKRIKK